MEKKVFNGCIAAMQLSHPLFVKQLPGKQRLCSWFLFACMQTLLPRKSCVGCDFPLVHFWCATSLPQLTFSFHTVQLYQLSDSLWSPWLKFTWHISSRDLKTPHNGGKASLSPSCGVQEIKVQQLNNSQRVIGHVSPGSSLDEKLGHGTLNLFAVSRLQLDLVEVNCACAVTIFLRRKQHLIILLWFPFPFYSFFKIMGWASPICIFM